jgi:di/tricarboxylate transporter
MRPQPGWGIWFFVALPVCIISILLIWLLLLITFQPGRGTTIIPIRPMKDKFTGVQWFISGVTVLTIVLWCITHQLESVFGDMGVVAIIPIVLFFGTGILTKEDFNNFLWTIIILAAGGLSLGKAVSSSGLLHTIAGAITEKVEGMSLYGVLVVFASLMIVVATFISHTVAALIILPLVAQVGQGMSEPHPNLLVFSSVIICSAAAGLPTSGFPNMSESPFLSFFPLSLFPLSIFPFFHFSPFPAPLFPLRFSRSAFPNPPPLTHLTRSHVPPNPYIPPISQSNNLVAAIMMEDDQTGQRYLQVKHFISRGIPASVITFVVVITVGYGLLRVVGF